MNSYTLISKNKLIKWIKYFFILPFIYIVFIFSFNFIIDPYELTSYNILKIENKLTRNDRIDKIKGLRKYQKLDNLILGSSRVYSINPKSLEKYLGGTQSYNFAIGGSQPEDHLGVMLYLERINKLPTNLVLGIDFNSFNPNIAINKYFLKSQELNFLNKNVNQEKNFFNKFLTIDATRASFKTLTNHFKKRKAVERFNNYGMVSAIERTYNNINELNIDKEKIFKGFYKGGNYPSLDKKRLSYILNIIDLCKKHTINLYMYTSPTYIKNLIEIKENKDLVKRLNEFKKFFKNKNNFVDLLKENEFSKNNKYFLDRVHTTNKAGDKILEQVFSDKRDK